MWERSEKGEEMKSGTHVFNNDLLLPKSDQEKARFEYPAIYHVLDFPELRKVFYEYDKPANEAKAGSWKAGITSIVLIFAALCLASNEYVFDTHAMKEIVGSKETVARIKSIIPIVSAVLALTGVAIGSMGFLNRKRKAVWLRQRIMTERLRQFHFQTFVLRADDIARSIGNELNIERFKDERLMWLSEFKSRIGSNLDGELANIIKEDKDDEPYENVEELNHWAHPFNEACFDTEAEIPEELFSAYRDLRIMHQIGYAKFKLRSNKVWGTQKWQSAKLSELGIGAIIVMTIIHLVVLFWASVSPHSWDEVGIIANIIVTIIAFIALALRAVEAGLQPEREIERYQQYEAALHAIKRRFDCSKTQRERLLVMKDMERLSFDEMRNFIITNERAKFAM
jgi:hypothetical protein